MAVPATLGFAVLGIGAGGASPRAGERGVDLSLERGEGLGPLEVDAVDEEAGHAIASEP